MSGVTRTYNITMRLVLLSRVVGMTNNIWNAIGLIHDEMVMDYGIVEE